MDPRIGITLKIIGEQIDPMQFGLADMSSMLGLSETYLLRLFHREVGKTFRQYLREVTMLRAARLLTNNNTSIKQIAFECGYSDLSNFYRDFKHVHAKLPRQLRLEQWTALGLQTRRQTSPVFHNTPACDHK
jgi:AraC-like DNA-binding protein